ncbi:conserved hypothetical protein [Histoplasma capsulatum H143]|uniref:Complex 1 LYR protein domain-containing protein n=1 Tax=Ajellomyces capsulatus (strain H143) TaxID=544712 RepID=C6HSF0_AJECH|nr:conserved hypothetical protein [Histoplasma capsulatum H143]
MKKLSGLQREVCSLYRLALREIRKKPKESQANFKQLARYAESAIYLHYTCTSMNYLKR